MNVELRSPSEEEMKQIRIFIHAMELDDRNLEASQFTAAYNKGKLIGFGRLRDFGNCTELCSLGVIDPYRNKGVGKALVKALVDRSRNDLYLVCIIADYFIPLGFQVTEEYPGPITGKLNYCREALHVPETYVVMKYSPDFLQAK
jgi:N-acetylglutamate synthase-like GNAT family acetyltransferase